MGAPAAQVRRGAAQGVYDISGPASTGREAIQWLYFAYLGATKEQNGAAMSLGRTSTFLDGFLQRDIAEGRPLVTRTSFRYLQTLYDLGPAPEPDLTVLWWPALPEGFKRFCAQVSLDTSAIQYENDELIRRAYSDDTAPATV